MSPCQPCAAERLIADRNAAREHLKGCGFVVQRKSLDDAVPQWWVSTYRGWFSCRELIELARLHGFQPERAAA